MSEKYLNTFKNDKLCHYADTTNGFTTGDNEKFLRLWFEVADNNICYNSSSITDSIESGRKWFPYNKGGNSRKWYGNNDFLINWFNNGLDIKAYGHLVPRSMKYMFRQSITWSKICSTACAFRIKDTGTMFDVAGLSMFPFDESNVLYLLGYCNSKYSISCLSMLSPTLNYETGHVAAIPVIICDDKESVNDNVTQNIDIARNDWDSFETSWDFKKHPLI